MSRFVIYKNITLQIYLNGGFLEFYQHSSTNLLGVFFLKVLGILHYYLLFLGDTGRRKKKLIC